MPAAIVVYNEEQQQKNMQYASHDTVFMQVCVYKTYIYTFNNRTLPSAYVVVCSQPECVVTGGVESCDLMVPLVPKVTLSENAVLLSLQRRRIQKRHKDKNGH